MKMTERKFEVELNVQKQGVLFPHYTVECEGTEIACRRTLKFMRENMPEEKVRLIEVIEE